MSMIPEPPPPTIKDNRGSSVRTLRERCAGLGIPTWRCDNSGLILSDPQEDGPCGLFLGSDPISQAVSRVARQWGAEAEPLVTQLFPGAWAVPLPESRRRERTGITLGLALDPSALERPEFELACAAASLEAPAMRRLMASRARFTQAGAESLRHILLWMAQDLARVEEHDYTIAGFTRQLGDCFETIDLMYALGRSMGELSKPEMFITRLCERLQATLSFGFVGIWFLDSPKLSPSVSGKVFVTPQPAIAPIIAQALPSFVATCQGNTRAHVLTELGGVLIPGSGQVLAYPVLRSGQPVGALIAGDKFGDDPQVSSYDIQLIEAAAGYVGAFMDNAGLYADQQALFLGTIEALSAAIDAKDRYTRGHSQRVAHLSTKLAIAAGMSADDAERVRIAGLVHDVGKIGVPEAVLTKSGRLSDEEFDAIKMHPEIGHRILRDIRLLEDVLPGVLYHHERYDGRGYPAKLTGQDIPLIARVIALADTFDAMSSNRSYRSALPRAQVLAEIARCAGSQFDPELARVFVELDFAEFDQIVAAHASLSAQRPGLASAA
jgi:HD-GYP domain-containing protein (c-di-GMP phosphodiesterase class II)